MMSALWQAIPVDIFYLRRMAVLSEVIVVFSEAMELLLVLHLFDFNGIGYAL